MLAAVTPEPPQPPAHRVAENAMSSCLTVVLRWGDFVPLTVSGVIFIVISGESLLISHEQRPAVQLDNTQNISAQKNHASPNSNGAGAESLGVHLEVAAPLHYFSSLRLYFPCELGHPPQSYLLRG